MKQYLMAVEIWMLFFWVVMKCGFSPEDGDSTFLETLV
jgi:hypothetical protein